MLPRRLARALLVAGSCGLASTALAQTGVPLPPLTQPATAPAPSLTPAQPAAGAPRLEAIKVEVALLGDPQTYSQPVEVRVEHDTILLVGQVQDDATRKRILEVARQSCYLPVCDGMSTIARTAGHTAVKVPLQTSARDALVRQLGSKADRFQITTTEDGKVTLKGEVPCAEEKLAASRALRGLPGCTQVLNCLTVRTVKQAGHEITVVSSDGQTVVCTPATAKPSEAHGGTTEAVLPAVTRVERPNGPAPEALPSGLPATRTVNVTTVRNGKEVTRPVVYVVPTATGYATSEPTSAPVPPAAAPVNTYNCPSRPFQEGVVIHEAQPEVKKRSFFDRLFPLYAAKLRRCPTPKPRPELTAASPLGGHPPLIPTVQAQPAALPQPTPAAAPAPATPTPPAPLPAPPALEPKSSGEAASLPTPPAAPVAPPVVSTVAKQMPTESVTPVPEAALPPLPATGAWPPAHDVRPATAAPRDAIYRSRPLAGVAARSRTQPPVETTAPPAAPVLPSPMPAPQAKPAAPAPLTPTAAKLPPAEPAAVVPAAPAAPVAPKAPAAMRMTTKELIGRVKSGCGNLVKEVKVESGADHKIVVHVYARSAAEQVVIGKLLLIPELAASNVQLQLHLAD